MQRVEKDPVICATLEKAQRILRLYPGLCPAIEDVLDGAAFAIGTPNFHGHTSLDAEWQGNRLAYWDATTKRRRKGEKR